MKGGKVLDLWPRATRTTNRSHRAPVRRLVGWHRLSEYTLRQWLEDSDVLGLSTQMAQSLSSHEHDTGMIYPTLDKISNATKSVDPEMDRTSPEYPGIEDCVPRARPNKAKAVRVYANFYARDSSLGQPGCVTIDSKYVAHDSSAVGNVYEGLWMPTRRDSIHSIGCYPVPRPAMSWRAASSEPEYEDML